MNSKDVKTLYNAGVQFFKNQDMDIFNSLINVMSQPYDLSKCITCNNHSYIRT
jgi:hypothetical protein